MLTAIAGSIITVATTVLSITIVALQLAARQFSPRILRGYTRDRGNQLVLSTSIATFVYTFLVLQIVYSQTADFLGLVPAASIGVAMLLARRYLHWIAYLLLPPLDTDHPRLRGDRPGGKRYIDAHRSMSKTGFVGAGDRRVRSLDHVGRVGISAGRSGYITGIDADALAGTYETVATISLERDRHQVRVADTWAVP